MVNLQERKFEPLVTLYAITAGEEQFVNITPGERRFAFTYEMFGMYNGFQEAIDRAAPNLARNFSDMGDNRGTAQPRIVTHTDDNQNQIKVELFHPSYSPFDTGVPLMFIQVQNLDEPVAEQIVVLHIKKLPEVVANG